jgi:hypothetical protein
MLPAPDPSPNAKEHAAKMLRELGACGIIKRANDKGADHKAWAKRIMERAKRKDTSLSLLQISFATEALGAADEAMVDRMERAEVCRAGAV